MEKIQLFQGKNVRTAWNAENEEWCFSVVDVVGVLTDQETPRSASTYWAVLKNRLKEEGASELLTNCKQLKMLASDGKKRLTDVANVQQLLRIIQFIPTSKAEPFKVWLAQVSGDANASELDSNEVYGIDCQSNNVGRFSDIESKIYTLRGTQIMLDSDLAELYDVETKALKQQVKRNRNRFPEDIMFELSKEEFESLRSQNVTSNKRGGNQYLPFAFTETGVAMLSSVLTSEKAILINLQIMRAFVSMRRFIVANAQVFQRIESLELKQIKTERKVDDILDKLDDGTTKPIQGIVFEGKVFDARLGVSNIIKLAKREIVLIDPYVDARTFDILEDREKNVAATIYTSRVTSALRNIKKLHDAQYPQRHIRLKKCATNFHDRFLIVDDDVYHFGASFKDLGQRLFAFEKMELDKKLIISQL